MFVLESGCESMGGFGRFRVVLVSMQQTTDILVLSLLLLLAAGKAL